jgi:hypothetical protein
VREISTRDVYLITLLEIVRETLDKHGILVSTACQRKRKQGRLFVDVDGWNEASNRLEREEVQHLVF